MKILAFIAFVDVEFIRLRVAVIRRTGPGDPGDLVLATESLGRADYFEHCWGMWSEFLGLVSSCLLCDGSLGLGGSESVSGMSKP